MPHRFNQVKLWYRKRALRERLLLSGGALILVVLGGMWVWNQWEELIHKKEIQEGEKAYQESVMAKQEEVEKRLEGGLAVFDKEKTFERNQFLEKVETLARGTGMKYRTEGMQESNLEVFEEYSVVLRFENMDIGGLVNFLKSIDAMNPYLGLYQLEVVPEKRDPRQLKVTSGLVAIRLKDGTNS